jgi:hypothetical protein
MMQKVIEAMKTIRDYCKSLPVDGCCKCLFKAYCFGMNPEDWDIEEATRLKETKSIEQVICDFPNATIYPTAKFASLVEDGCFCESDGSGRFHDGVDETDVSVWDEEEINQEYIDKYPYVCWYSK